MSVAVCRAVLRRTQLVRHHAGTRKASTTAEAANALKDRSSEATSKASQGLSRVTSEAGSALTSAGTAASNAASRVGGTAGRLIGIVNTLIPPAIHYSRVGMELAKIVFQGRQMSPPSLTAFQSYMQPLMNVLRNPTSIFRQTTTNANIPDPASLLNNVRNMNRQQLTAAGVVAAEVLGFFTVGEMIGRFKIVGYRHAPEIDLHEHH